MLQRTSARLVRHGREVVRRPRSFRAWSGTALARYVHESEGAEPRQPNSSSGQNQRAHSCAEEETSKRREQLQELLRQIDAERLDQNKKLG